MTLIRFRLGSWPSKMLHVSKHWCASMYCNISICFHVGRWHCFCVFHNINLVDLSVVDVVFHVILVHSTYAHVSFLIVAIGRLLWPSVCGYSSHSWSVVPPDAVEHACTTSQRARKCSRWGGFRLSRHTDMYLWSTRMGLCQTPRSRPPTLSIFLLVETECLDAQCRRHPPSEYSTSTTTWRSSRLPSFRSCTSAYCTIPIYHFVRVESSNFG